MIRLHRRLKLANNARSFKCTMKFFVASRIPTTKRLCFLVSTISFGLTSIVFQHGPYILPYPFPSLSTLLPFIPHLLLLALFSISFSYFFSSASQILLVHWLASFKPPSIFDINKQKQRWSTIFSYFMQSI